MRRWCRHDGYVKFRYYISDEEVPYGEFSAQFVGICCLCGKTERWKAYSREGAEFLMERTFQSRLRGTIKCRSK